jgi:chorismate mutase
MARDPPDRKNDRETDMTNEDNGTDERGETDTDGRDQQERPGDPAVGPDGRSPDEMTLAELREEIETLDGEIVELIARRTYVADTIAAVKDRRDLPTTDEAQEQAVMDRAGENAERFDVDSNLVKAIFRLLIELNKVEQREQR